MILSFFSAELIINTISHYITYSEPDIVDIFLMPIFSLHWTIIGLITSLIAYLILWVISGYILQKWSNKEILEDCFYVFSFTSPIWIIILPATFLIEISAGRMIGTMGYLTLLITWGFIASKEIERYCGVRIYKPLSIFLLIFVLRTVGYLVYIIGIAYLMAGPA